MFLCQDPIIFQNGFSQIKILNMPKLKYNSACLDKYSLSLIWQFICIALSEFPNFYLPKIPLYFKHIQYNQQNHISCEWSESFLHTSYTWSTICSKISIHFLYKFNILLSVQNNVNYSYQFLANVGLHMHWVLPENLGYKILV